MNLIRTRIFWMTLLAVIMMSGAGCKKKVVGPSESRDALGTKVTVTIYDPGHTPESLKPIFDDVFQVMADWERRALARGENNQVHGVSRGAGEQSVTTDHDVFQMLMKGIRLYDNSGQVFDIRYGPMLDAWGFDDRPSVPAPERLDTLRGYVGEGGMFVAGNGILLARSGMRFDVRELVEGHVFDLVAARLAEKGIRTAAIHSPYVWRLMGDAPDRRGFPVTFDHPATGDSAWATVWAPVGGVALAAVSKGRFEANGRDYHSLLDPRTGMPADKVLGAVVHSADAATAQALAYAVFVHGSVDSLAPEGIKAVGGSIVIEGTAGAPRVAGAGSLADRIDVRR